MFNVAVNMSKNETKQELDQETLDFIQTRKDDSHYYSLHWIICRQVSRRLNKDYTAKYPYVLSERNVPPKWFLYYKYHCVKKSSSECEQIK